MKNNPIKEFRRKIGLTQKALGKAIGVEQTAIANYESGIRVPSRKAGKRFIAFARRHGHACTLDDLYPEEIEETENAHYRSLPPLTTVSRG